MSEEDQQPDDNENTKQTKNLMDNLHDPENDTSDLQNAAIVEDQSKKNESEPIDIYSFSCRIQIWIQNLTKTIPKPDFDQISKKSDFYKNR